MADPTPFEIVEHDGVRHASNGALTLTVLEGDALLFRRRAIKTEASNPPAEVALPRVNELAGQLLAQPGMPADEISRRLLDIAETLAPKLQRRIEWAVAKLDGVFVYTDGANVIVTRQDMTP